MGGGWLEEFGNNANSVQLLLQLPTRTELGNINSEELPGSINSEELLTNSKLFSCDRNSKCDHVNVH